MQTVREVVENTTTDADIFEIRNARPTGVFYYDKKKLFDDFGSRMVEEILIIKGITGHDAILRMYIKTKSSS